MSRTSERLLPFIAAGVAALLAVVVAQRFEVEPFSRFVSAGTMALGLIVAGFTATQRNMLLGMSGSRVLRRAAASGYDEDILNYLARCIYAGLFVTLVSVAGVFIEDCSWIWISWLALWIGSIFFMVAQLVINEWLMSRIFKRFMEDELE